MKLPNLEKVKKMKPGGKKTPEQKRFHISNPFLQKNLLSLIVVAVLAIGTGTAYGTLSSQAADRGNDPVSGVNKDRFQVLVSGKGYKLSKNQEKDYKLQKKQNKVNAANTAQNPKVIRSTNGSRIFRSGSAHHYNFPGRSSYKSSKNPRLSSNISDQIAGLPDKIQAGEKLKFRVSAYAYPYGSKNVISKDNIKVTVEGGKEAKVYKEKSGYVYYEVELGQGTNKITISATDIKTKKTSKIGPYTIKDVAENSGSGGSTDPSHGSDDPTNTELNLPVTVTADLSECGLGNVSFNGTIINSDTTAYDVLKNISGITMSGQDILYISGDMDGFSLDGYSSSELQNIYKIECNETGEIEESEYADWLDEIENVVKDSGKLGKDYPFGKTKWAYDKSKKGRDLESGITLTLILYDD